MLKADRYGIDARKLQRQIDNTEIKQQSAEADILHPSVSILCALGSIAVHVEEYVSPKGHPYDLEAIKSVLSAPEVIEWLEGMRKAAFLPVKR